MFLMDLMSTVCRKPRPWGFKIFWPYEAVRTFTAYTLCYTFPYSLLDPPRGEEYWIPTDSRFSHAIDLVKHIKNHPEFSESFCVGVAGVIFSDHPF